ncbi:SAM-dependent methyltransferase [Streptosporangium becharense]|uniref:SAM-dependent methyltransferase n=1 Tax=Streptosporangium becharense TaxID=1816182 RepID=A0A7W9IMW7_9ACTN|nr:class I SAM-dependent methyltransferase [Streptosporangium becharense]MBB2914284.1 SAM-dependent methyltransferase [Streptosporangium becharense]MBB5823684.1 SAM-dependent methyltransferase [Streptosporangium becharense]
MTAEGRQQVRAGDPLPGAGLDAERMPGHWLLARLGKRVLRPGGVELSRWMLDALRVEPADQVVELAPGLGATARLALSRGPAGYVGVDRDSAAIATLARLPRPAATQVRWHTGDAASTGLPGASASVVYGEAMLTMQPEPAKRRIVAEAHRLLGPAGRYGIHELCLVPGDLDPVLAEEIRAALSEAIHVGARPLTVPQWRDLLTGAGFTVTAETTTPMHLLEPRRLIADEGLAGALGIISRMMRDAPSRRRALRMRGVFRRYRAHLAAVGLVAVRA